MTAPAIPIPDFSEEVFRAIVNQHARWLFASAYRQLRDRHLAEDAVQSVFVLLIRRSRTMPPPEKLSGWLFNTLSYTVRNLRRSLRRRAHHEAAAARPAEEAASPEIVTELALQLDSAVARLGESDRTAILMRFYQDLSYDEIATTLGITEPAARKRVSRAAELLRGRMGAQATIAAIAAAAIYGMTDAPAALAATSVTTALAAQTGAAIPASIAAATKGTVSIMALTKAQAAAIAVAVAVMVAVPVTIVSLKKGDLTPAAAPVVAPAVDPIVVHYGLEPGQVVKIVKDAPPETRRAVWQMLQLPQAWDSKVPEGPMVFDWNNGTPQNLVVMGVTQVPLKHALTQVAAMVLNMKPSLIEIKATVPDEPFTLNGDLVYNSAFPPKESIPLLEKAAEELLNLKVKVTLAERQEEAIVLSGNWHRDGLPADVVLNIYGSHPDRDPQKSLRGKATNGKELGQTLSEWLRKPVVIEAENMPAEVMYLLAVDELNPDGTGKGRDAGLVLGRILEQTGLKLRKESRAISRVVIEDRPSPLDRFKLAEGEVLKRFADTSDEIRLAWWQDINRNARGVGSPDLPSAFMLRVQDEWNRGWTMPPGDGGLTLGIVAEYLLDTYVQEIEGEGVTMPIPGDLLARDDAKPEQLRAALENILRNEMKQPVTLVYRDVERKVVVLKGEWHYTAHPKQRMKDSPNPVIEVYESNPVNQAASMAIGDARRFTGMVGKHIRKQIVIEATGVPPRFVMVFNAKDGEPRDMASVLNHVAEQTGLTWVEEPRTVRRLFIEAAK